MLSKLARLPVRVFRHILVDRSYQSYYSAEIWENKYRNENYDLGDPKEDGRYGALMQVLRRYDRGSILDLGCGDGLLWKHYRPLSDSLPGKCGLFGSGCGESKVTGNTGFRVPSRRLPNLHSRA